MAAGWLLWAAVLLLAGASGCRPPRPVALRLVVDYRGGSAREVEAALWPPVQQALAQTSEVAKVVGVCTASRMEVFVIAEAGTDERRLLDRVDELMAQNLDQLPAEAVVSMAQAYHGSRVPPDFDIHQEPVLRIHLDQERMASLGVSAAETGKKIKDATPQIVATQSLAGLKVANRDGQLVPLAAVARVEVEYQPSHRVQTWTPATAGPSGP